MSNITPQALEEFRRDGVVLIKNFLSGAQVEAGRRAVTSALSRPGPQAEFLSSSCSTWESLAGSWTTAEEEQKQSQDADWTMFQDQFSSKRCQEMMDFVKGSGAAKLAAAVMRSTEASFFYDHVIIKRPVTDAGAPLSSNAIPWHQDLPYWSVHGTQFATVWIPLDPIRQEASAQYVVGSHLDGLYRPRHFVDSSPYAGCDDMRPMPDIDALIESGEARVKRFAVDPGDVVVFDARLVHGSPSYSQSIQNQQQQQHRRVALRFGGDDAVFWKYDSHRETAIPTPDVRHGLSHGEKLSNSDAFPRLWPPS